jgi:hypothetical protein
MKPDRPSVLAHERFMADRASFVGLGLAPRFERIVHGGWDDKSLGLWCLANLPDRSPSPAEL